MRTWPLAAIAMVGLAVSAGAGAHIAGCGWRTVLNRQGATLTAIVAVGPSDVWTVGVEESHGLILHWDGHGWQVVERPGIVPLDVDAASARAIWVVGESVPGSRIEQARSERWDGVKWTVEPVPARPASYVRAVSVGGLADAWAVGANGHGPLLVRWNGSTWRSVSTGPSDGLLHAIDGSWAVGTSGRSSATTSEDPLVERLVGGHWRIVPTPSVDSVDENLLAVDAVSSADVWAVGSADVLGGRAPLVLRLNGHVWESESVDGLPSSQSALQAVAAFSSNDVWAGGYGGFRPQRTLLAHWDGGRWLQAPGARRLGSIADLSGLSSRDIWAVGSSGSGSFVERYACG